jgi:hypothetical protein
MFYTTVALSYPSLHWTKSHTVSVGLFFVLATTNLGIGHYPAPKVPLCQLRVTQS